MAAIGKIRSKGRILAIIIGLALFSFIAEELFRSCQSTRNDRLQQIGRVLGQKVSMQEFQVIFDEYQEAMKLTRGADNFSEEETNQIKDAAWNTFVQAQIIRHEADKLGLTVTDAELQDVLTQGTNPMLLQTPFVDQETGRFNVNELKKFLADYKTQQSNPQLAQQYTSIYNYWTFVERNLRENILAQKYQVLFSNCLLANNIEAKAAFDANRSESTVDLVAFAYEADTAAVAISEADMKKKYDELKPTFRQYVEMRDVKYIDVKVEPTAADRKEIEDQMETYAQELADDDVADVVRRSTSLVSFLGLPVKKNAFPSDIAAMLDSLSVGQVSRIFETRRDNTLNVMKIISKVSLPDSVEYRQIQVIGDTPDVAHQRADSIYDALKAGSDFELIAKQYDQTGEPILLTTAQYQTSPTLDTETRDYLDALNNMAVGEIRNIPITQGNIIVKIEDRKAFVDKYLCAVVKKTIDFSHDTYSAAYNAFSAFVSANQTEADLLKNAEEKGYVVREYVDMTTANHGIANIRGTHDALRWTFQAKQGEVSPIYECGTNDHLLVLALDRINKKGYRELSDPQVAEIVRDELTKEKKANRIKDNIKDVKDIASAESKGGRRVDVSQITFNSPVFVIAIGGSEPALSGAIVATDKGHFSKHPIEGELGVYVFAVTDRTESDAEFDATVERATLRQQYMQWASGIATELYNNAEVVDNRYLFY